MEATKILHADILDLVFDNRNKDYGAYELRKSYSNRITKSMLLTGLLVAGMLSISMIPRSERTSNALVRDDSVVIVATEIPKEIKPEIPEPVRAAAPTPPARTERVTQIEIVKDNVVIDPIATTADIDVAIIDVKTATGEDPDNKPRQPEGPATKGILVEADPKPEAPLREVDEHAKFNGDWTKFLRRNLRAEVPVDNEAPNGRYTVLVEFVVDVDGSVSQVTALTAHGFGLEQEAVRVIKKSDKWTPSFWKGRPVKAYHKQQITFEVVGSD